MAEVQEYVRAKRMVKSDGRNISYVVLLSGAPGQFLSLQLICDIDRIILQLDQDNVRTRHPADG